MKNLWIFDFDGTLVDSQIAIKKCYLKVAELLVPNRIEFIKNMTIGPTLEESCKMILTKKNIHLINEFMSIFQKLYDSKLVFESLQFENVNETLINLLDKGDEIWIATNKRSFPTHQLINSYKWNNFFTKILCLDKFPEFNSKVELLKSELGNKNNYKNIFFVGDTVSDGIAANKNDIFFILAGYGYGKKDNWKQINILKKIENIKELINNQLS